MSFLDGVLPDPAERVRHTLTRDLELRRSDARASAKFSGYAYVGSADLLLQHGRFFTGRQLPEQYAHLYGEPGRCYLSALEAAQADPSLTYYEGVYAAFAGPPCSHAWCVAPDGGVVECAMVSDPVLLAMGHRSGSETPFLPPEHWGYWGVSFTTQLVDAHLHRNSLPMFDRSRAELLDTNDPENVAETHDFPVLKVRYNPNRTELP
jgi:hypothetical protein